MAGNNPETLKAYYRANRDAALQRASDWRIANRERRREIARDWKKRNPGKVLANTRPRQAAKLKATPRWADLAEIATIYEAASLIGYEVDHIVPLRSDKVCGLHCTANLRIVEPGENRAKGNRWWPDMFEENS